MGRKMRKKKKKVRAVSARRSFARKRKGKPWIDYRERAIAVAAVGFAGYAEYLESRLWAEIRGRVLTRDKGRCKTCNRRATQVHHCAYDLETMSGRDIDRLASVCGRCHQEIEFNRDGTHRTPEERGATYKVMRGSLKSKMYSGIHIIDDGPSDPLSAEFYAIVRDEFLILEEI